MALSILVLVSLFAWKLKDVLKEWMPLTLLGLFLTCFVINSTILFPSSSLLVVLEYSYILNPVSVVLVGGIGASLGELTGYMVGVEGGTLLRRFKKVLNLSKYRKYAFLWVMFWAIIPFPVFDVAGILAGSIRMSPLKFLLACFIGKSIKMGFYVWTIHFISIIFG